MRKDLYTSGSVDIPKITKGRSFFDLSHSSHIDMNLGILYPVDQVIEIIPGDTFDYSHRLNIRMTNPPKTPTMDQLVFDIYYFYVPNRIVWSDWDNFISNYSGNDFYVGYTGSIPVIDIAGRTPSTNYASLHHSVLDYLGFGGMTGLGSTIPILNPNALPVRGYYKIWNEYFRYESLQHPIYIANTHNSVLGSSYSYYAATTDPASYWGSHGLTDCCSLCLLPVNRLPGYFSRALPAPQAGSDVAILNQVQIGNATNPVIGQFGGSVASDSPLTVNGGSSSSGFASNYQDLESLSGKLISTDNSIRALSQAFALNKFLYIDNVYGKRITEWTYGHFGVNVPDSRVQRPEFLAKKRVYININQIVQSSSTDSTSAQGNAGAWSQTFDVGHDFDKSFVEYGFLFALGCIRVLNHTFAQGNGRFWSYRSRFDEYLPEFNNVGDQAVYQREIYANTTTPDKVWGYQERFAEYKMIPSRVAGYMRPQISGTLALWTYTDYYTSAPSLSATWMFEPHGNFNDTIYVADTTAPSFILDYVADIKAYRTMPYHSLPGDLTGNW